MVVFEELMLMKYLQIPLQFFFFFQILILSSVWQPDHSVLISSGEKKMIAEIKKVEEREYFSDFEFESSHSKAMERFYGKSKYFGQNPKSKR